MADQWREITEVLGGITAYAILVKVFDFIRYLRRDKSGDCQDAQRTLAKVLRLVQRIADRLDLRD